MDMKTPTRKELQSLPHVTMTSDMFMRSDNIENEHVIKDIKNPDKETPVFGDGKVNETEEIMELV